MNDSFVRCVFLFAIGQILVFGLFQLSKKSWKVCESGSWQETFSPLTNGLNRESLFLIFFFFFTFKIFIYLAAPGLSCDTLDL